MAAKEGQLPADFSGGDGRNDNEKLWLFCTRVLSDLIKLRAIELMIKLHVIMRAADPNLPLK